MQCKYCGCTDDNACAGGCSWIANDACSNCSMVVPLMPLARLLGIAESLRTYRAIFEKMSAPERRAFIESLEEESLEIIAGWDNAAEAGTLLSRVEIETWMLDRMMPDAPPPAESILAKAQIILATEADIPPFPRELQL